MEITAPRQTARGRSKSPGTRGAAPQENGVVNHRAASKPHSHPNGNGRMFEIGGSTDSIREQTEPHLSATSIQRTDSIADLTTPSLYGIYEESEFYENGIEDSTSNGPTGDISGYNSILDFTKGFNATRSHSSASDPLRTLNKRLAQAQAANGQVKHIPAMTYRETKHTQAQMHNRPAPSADAIFREALTSLFVYFLPRAAILFVFGIGYTELAHNIHDNHYLTPEYIVKPIMVSKYLSLPIPQFVVAGLEGVFAGCLLPLVDYFFPCSRGSSGRRSTNNTVLRGAIAFLGISYGIRQVNWTSSMHAALTWALFNTAMWLSFDRTRNGLIVASTVAIVFTLAVTNYFDRDSFPEMDLRDEKYLSVIIWVMSFYFCGLTVFGTFGRFLFSSQ